MLLGLALSGCVNNLMPAPHRPPPSPRAPGASPDSTIISRGPAQWPSVISTSDNRAVREAAAAELGPQVAGAIPTATRPTGGPEPSDPGAAQLVQSMLEGMGQPARGSDGLTHIGMAQLRNQSRSSGAEFRAMCERLAGLLTRAAQRSDFHFTADPQAQVQYQIQGSAYLTNVEGSDAWELFLSMTPAAPRERSWTIWEAGRPVHLLRQRRPGQPQIVGGPRR